MKTIQFGRPNGQVVEIHSFEDGGVSVEITPIDGSVTFTSQQGSPYVEVSFAAILAIAEKIKETAPEA